MFISLRACSAREAEAQTAQFFAEMFYFFGALRFMELLNRRSLRPFVLTSGALAHETPAQFVPPHI